VARRGTLVGTMRRTQRGMAIITALLVVMLAATIATFLLAQQSEALTRVERTSERAQLSLHAATTLEWARSALLAQQKNSVYVALTQPWAQGLIARPIDGAIANGLLRDAQAKFNINNLIAGDGKRRDADVLVFTRLVKSLGYDENLVNAIVDWIDRDDDISSPGGAESGYYASQTPAWRAANRPLVDLDELLRVRGIDESVLAKLSPFVTALPTLNGERVRININTTSIEVLTALFPEATTDALADMLRLRELPFKDLADIKSRHKTLSAATLDTFADVKSRYFEASLAITGSRSQIRQSALLQLKSTAEPGGALGWPAIIWVKDV
jgi:general secretion pathway protein K